MMYAVFERRVMIRSPQGDLGFNAQTFIGGFNKIV